MSPPVEPLPAPRRVILCDRWAHPAQDGEPCECLVVLSWSPNTLKPYAPRHADLTPPRSELPGAWFPQELPSRGSQGYNTHLRVGFYFLEPGEDDFGCSERGFCLITFSLCYEHIKWSEPDFQLMGTCSVSTNSRGLWLKLQMPHKIALACWSKCSYKFTLEW